MSFKQLLKDDLALAIKDRNDVTKNVIKVLISEIEAGENPNPDPKLNKPPRTDEQVFTLLELTLKNNKIMQGYKPDDVILKTEGEILNGLVAKLAPLLPPPPTAMSKEEATSKLAEKLEELRGCKSDGQATGIAMKYLKSLTTDVVDGGMVASLVKELRA